MRTLYRFHVFAAVPLGGEITYAQIAETVGLDESRTKRVMQHAMTNGFFAQTKGGRVVHSAESAAIARDEKLKALIGHYVEDVYPAVWPKTSSDPQPCEEMMQLPDLSTGGKTY